MKIYTNTQDYFKDLKYWSNSCGDLFNPHSSNGINDILEEDLPNELKSVYDTCWSENYGSFCYLAEYKDRYGLAIVTEYYKYNPEFTDETSNNIHKAVDVGIELEKIFGECCVFIGYETGFEAVKTNPISNEVYNDKATELVIFIDAEIITPEMTDEIGIWLLNNAYC